MSDWPELERRLIDSARQRPRHRRARTLATLVPAAAALAVVVLMLARAPQPATIPDDERPAPSGTVVTAPPPERPRPELPTGITRYRPVDARVIAPAPTSAGRRLTLDKGTRDGVHTGDPVIDAAGLVGTIRSTSSGSSSVALITDPSFATSAYVDQRRQIGSVTGVANELRFEPVDSSADLRQGQLVFTAGTTDKRLESRYPAAIPIGQVSRIDLGNGELDKRIHIEPFADLRRLDAVQVLTEPHAEVQERHR
jgi:cell shape-determining protein MreC